MRIIKTIINFLIVVTVIGIAVGCGSKAYRDGTYQGEAINQEQGGGTTVEITITQGEITECYMHAVDKEGNPKDENYGKDSGAVNYEKAQLAVEAMKQYPDLLIEAQNIDDVDAVSGATVTHKEFQMAVKDALKKAN